MTYSLKKMKNGAFSVHDMGYGETMHPGGGPWLEAESLYVNGGGLPQLLAAPASSPASPRGTGTGAGTGTGTGIVVFDVGLGAAANALAAVQCHQDRLKRGIPTPPMRLISFENKPSGARFALDEAQALGYPAEYEEALEALLEQGQTELPGGLRWELRLGDFTQLVAEEPARADLIFFDPFSPASNPEMWTLNNMEALYRCRRPGGETRLITYSSAFGVRAGLLAAGFFVGEGPRPGARGATMVPSTTIASTTLSGLAEPLTPAWLARWRKNPQPWPPMTPAEQRPKLRQALLDHPQWGGRTSSPASTKPPPGRPKRKRAAKRKLKG